ncbi:MAG: sulfatase-like hydrolase/transferase [Mariniblastus sp.]|nr:sulfatase-like hydrolase/transferase [Mariniblastus sp.]
MVGSNKLSFFRHIAAGLILISSLGGWAQAACAGLTDEAVTEKPNVVVILADDLGWGAVGYHSDFAETPNIDQFVASGIELDRFYVAPMCSPTRAGLLTGRYPIRFGLARAVIPPQRNFGLPVTERMLPELLAEAGYQQRGIFGKWHLGHHHRKWHPLSRGFTQFEGHYNGAIDYFDLTREGERDWHVGFEPSPKPGYATDLIADAACRFIEQAAADEAPYFCYVPFNAPHSPFQAKPADVQRYAQADKPTAEEKLQGMIWSMDQGIGRILQAIDETGESDNTQIWILSDNGGVGRFDRNNQPLRGSKLTTFEGGTRVIASVRWPARWKGERKITEQIGYIDLLPTIVTSAGLNPKALERPGRPLDGLPLNDLLAGTADDLPDRDWYSYHGQSGEQKETMSIHTADWKLIVMGPDVRRHEIGPDHQLFLFEIARDPLEKSNVANEHPKIVAELTGKLIAHRSLQPDASVPTFRVGKEGFQPWANWDIRQAPGSKDPP